MKQITLRDDQELTSKMVISMVMSNPLPNQGINPVQMRARIRVLDALEVSKGGVLTLEDADFKLLKETFSAYPFQGTHRDILTVSDDIESAEDVKPEPGIVKDQR